MATKLGSKTWTHLSGSRREPIFISLDDENGLADGVVGEGSWEREASEAQQRCLVPVLGLQGREINKVKFQEGLFEQRGSVCVWFWVGVVRT